MTKLTVLLSAAVLALVTLSACTTSQLQTSTYGAQSVTLKVCSGYGCQLSERFQPTRAEIAEIDKIMGAGTATAIAERNAIKRAIGFFERSARKHLRYRPDVEKAYQKNIGKRGQMDCVDESLNTTGYLKFIEARGLLKHHRVRSSYAERGLLIDGRYPHKSAVIIEQEGTSWTVDSWYHADGVEPQIMPLSAWRRVRNSFGS